MPLPAEAPSVQSLDLFVSVVHLGSLSAAAQAHAMSQPSASARIRQLERQLGVTLLDRGPNGSTPTAAGALVAEWAQQVTASLQDLLDSTRTLRSTPSSIRVAASFTVAEHLLPRWLGAVRQRHPDTAVELEVVNSAAVLDQVRSGTAQLGFIESTGAIEGLHSRVVGRDELVVVVDPQHPWGRRRRPLDIATLTDTPLVWRERGSGTRDALVAALVAHGAELASPALELASTSAVRAAVESGAGPGVLSRLTVADALAAGRLVVVGVADLDLRRDLRAVWSAQHLPPAARALLDARP